MKLISTKRVKGCEAIEDSRQRQMKGFNDDDDDSNINETQKQWKQKKSTQDNLMSFNAIKLLEKRKNQKKCEIVLKMYIFVCLVTNLSSKFFFEKFNINSKT